MSTFEFERMERAGWADPDVAAGYAHGFDRPSSQAGECLATRVRASPGKDVLDLCTGHGAVAATLLQRGADVTGVDFSPAMAGIATKAVPGARFVTGDAGALSFSDNSFDAVTIGFGVPHFPDPAGCLAEVARVLKPGGRFAFSIWRGPGSVGAFGWLFQAVSDHGDPSVTLPPGPDAHALVEIARARELLAPLGFEDIEIEDVASAILVTAPDQMFDIFLFGSVRAASLISGQPEKERTAIKSALSRAIEEGSRQEQGQFLIPVPSVVVSARLTRS